jgi:hypothetical protein
MRLGCVVREGSVPRALRDQGGHVISTRKLAVTLVAGTAATLAFAAFAVPAFADGGSNVVRESLLGSTPAPVSPVIAGVNPGGVPWINGPSQARIRNNGRTDVRIRQLVVTTTGVNPVLSVVATLVCNDMVAGSTMPFDLSAAGNGRTRDMISVPKHCMNPDVLIQPAANRTVYIASGMMSDDD